MPVAAEAAVVEAARALVGLSLGEVAGAVGMAVPPDLRSHKGWAGDAVERALGADGIGDEVDFPALGLELKTVPVDEGGVPRESTWVCACPLDGSLDRTWEGSRVRRKLARVLFVPLAGRGRPAGRIVRPPVLWSPDPAQIRALRADWEALTELVRLGEYWQLDARRGRVLQVRAKAARGSDLVWTVDAEGDWVRTVPRGFYLRRSFTRSVLAAG